MLAIHYYKKKKEKLYAHVLTRGGLFLSSLVQFIQEFERTNVQKQDSAKNRT